MYINPLTAIDFYKTDHRRQYPEGTTEVYSNFTARSSRMGGVKEVVFFGLQYFISDFLINTWRESFFEIRKRYVLEDYKRRMDNALGKDSINIDHIAALHDLGYLPLRIKALPEGTLVPIGVPMLTVVNTHPDFFWLTNYIETIMSCYLWKPITSATIAFEYKKLLTNYAKTTCIDKDFIKYQAHDFSFRGMSSPQDAAISGAGHLLSFVGTDTVLAIDLLEDYYFANAEKELIGCSVPATEHSCMSMGTENNELYTFRRLITELYPTGIISIVSDTWDFWHVINMYLPMLRPDIMARNGKVVIRPDSGAPVKIICGDLLAPKDSSQYKGAVECLWDIFGGTINSRGFKELDPHIGLIYGDSITLNRASMILEQLEAKGFASNNIVFGVGSYTYEYVTRDTFGFAMKATSGVVNGERRDIFKSPKTDDGEKTSAKGLLRVKRIENKLLLEQQTDEVSEAGGELRTVFMDGQLVRKTNLQEIRERLDNELRGKCYG
jgi:nicotinamide phosphoribosyltransferase